jgi:hypothetical protein
VHTFQPSFIKIKILPAAGTPERCEGKGGRFLWKGTFELIYTKRCLQNIGSWTSPNHVFYLLDDRGVWGFSARRLCYSWSSMTAFLAFSEANSWKNCTNISDNSLLRQGNSLNWKGTFAPLAPPGKGQRGRLPPPPQFRRPWAPLRWPSLLGRPACWVSPVFLNFEILAVTHSVIQIVVIEQLCIWW